MNKTANKMKRDKKFIKKSRKRLIGRGESEYECKKKDTGKRKSTNECRKR